MFFNQKDERIMRYVPASKKETIKCCWIDSDGYWIVLKDGYNAGRMDVGGCHTIHEDTIAELRYQIAGIEEDEEGNEDGYTDEYAPFAREEYHCK